MFIIRLIGGLGNQMFEYAAAYVAAKHNKAELKIDNLYYKDTSKRFHRFEYRPYALSLFKIPSTIATHSEINKFIFPRCKNKYIYHLFKHFHRDRNIFDENTLPTYKQLVNIPTTEAYLTGFFQKYEYFGNDIADIEQIFQFKENLPSTHKDISDFIKQTPNSVCVVFRRGDYVNHPVLGIIGLDFYFKAIALLQKQIPDLHLFVFSDDIPWCINNFKPQNCHVSFVDPKYTGPFGGYYLQLMMLCNHFIIPNSTYPYWAALLSKQNPNKIVIAPKLWYKGQDPKIRNQILPPLVCHLILTTPISFYRIKYREN